MTIRGAFVQGNAVDLHSVGRVSPLPLATATGVGVGVGVGGHIDPVKLSINAWHSFFFSFVCNKPKVKFMYSPDHTEH